MPDQRSVMKEFRSLEEKRAAGGLTPTEEARLAHLRDLIGPEMGAGSLRPGFDVDAAAAQLRDSLLPAGFRRPPPAPAPAEPVPANAPDDALASVYAAEPFAPLETPQQPEALFDPSSLSPHAGEPAYDPAAASNDPSQPAWDPNVPFDANAAVYDPNASYDPNAQYDANAPYDPNAAYAATEGQDPNAQAGWDPDVPYDPAQPGAQPYDGAAQPYAEDAPADPGAQAWDAAQPGEPGAQAAWDAAATYDGDAPPDAAGLAWDPAASPDAGAQAYPEPAAAVDAEADLLAEPGSAEAGFPSGAEGSRDGWLAEPAGATPEPPYAAAAPAGEDAGLESMLPFDPAAAAAIAPGEVPEGFGSDTGEYDDTAGFDTRFADATPADLPQEEPSFQAAQSIEPEAAQGWQPDAVLEEGFQLASGGSFDAAAEAAAPEWAGGTAAPPWESGAAAEEPSDAFAPPEATPIADDAFVEAPEPGGSAPDAPAEALAELAVEAELAEPLSTVGELAAPPGETPAAPDDFSVDVDAEPAPAGAAQALDFSQPDFSAGSPSEEEAAFVDAAVGPGADAVAVAEASFDVSVEADGAVPAIDLATAAIAPAEAPAPAGEEEIPTIEGEEILEEIPPEEAAAEAAGPQAEPEAAPEAAPPPVAVAVPPPPSEPVPPPAAAAPPAPEDLAASPEPLPPEPGEAEASFHVPGSHRVVVHTVEGQVKRGLLEDVDLGAGELGLVAQPGAAPDLVPAEKVKAIFFMLGPGERAPAPEGKKVRVTFLDGRQVAGFSPDYREAGVGFFMIPGDTRTNTGRIWVYRSAVRQVSVS